MSKDKITVSMNIYDIPILVEELEKANNEILRLNNIIDELEKWLNENWNKPLAKIYVADVVKKISELKEE